ncbi:protein kinase domain-containing protein [Catenulispora subtropica]|uniref:Protein kinase domain-containing protein n=1 Tax=Catenulispora subtropica TaxID=450798 RepID=A0ABN2RP75_9ACTN
MEPLDDADPRRAGPYLLFGRLGSGGMGAVYLGRSVGGRTVAIKVVRPDLARDGEFRDRFRSEVAAARAVSGAFTAPVVDADPDGAMPWMATAFVPGVSLHRAVASRGPLPEPALRMLAAGIAEALAGIHAAGLIHRDLKPANVLLAATGPHVIDFGISRAVEGTSGLTATGAVIGSPGYMSPEQALGHRLTPASDVFSLGATLVYAAGGRGPFGEGSPAVLLYRVANTEPDLSALPGSLTDLVTACVAKDPGARPTPRQLVEELERRASAVAAGSWLPPALTADIVAAGQAIHALPVPAAVPDPGAAGAGAVPGDRSREIGDAARSLDPTVPMADPRSAVSDQGTVAGGIARRRVVFGAAGAAAVVLGGGAAAWAALAGSGSSGSSGGPGGHGSSSGPGVQPVSGASSSSAAPPTTVLDVAKAPSAAPAWTHTAPSQVASLAIAGQTAVCIGSEVTFLGPDGKSRFATLNFSTLGTAAQPTVSGSMVYTVLIPAGSLAAEVVAIDTSVGKAAWTFAPADSDGLTDTVWAVGDGVYLSGMEGTETGADRHGFVTALDAKRNQLWRVAGRDIVNVLVPTTGTHWLAGSQPDDSTLQVQVHDAAAKGAAGWKDTVKTDGFLSSGTTEFAYASGKFFYGSDQLIAADVQTGAHAWTFKSAVADERFGAPLASPDGRTVYVAGFSHLYALDASNGTPRWIAQLTASNQSFSTTSPMKTADGNVYVGDTGQNIWALAADTGQARWKYSDPRQAGSQLMFDAGGGRLYAVAGRLVTAVNAAGR